MIDFDDIRTKLACGHHFSLARFNDGEMKAVMGPGKTVARGAQHVPKSLSQTLRRVLKEQPAGLYLGRPCGLCFRQCRRVYDRYVAESHAWQAEATVLCNNGRWLRSFEAILNAAEGRPVYWIGNDQHDLTCFHRRGIRPTQYALPTRDAWSQRGMVQDLEFPTDALVLLSCGPLSRVLAWKYWSRQQDVTVLDVGSLIDPLTRNVWHGCHVYGRKTRRCRQCDHSFEDGRLRQSKGALREQLIGRA